MTTLNCQNRRTGQPITVTIAKLGARADIIAYAARVYPDLHIRSFG